MASTEAGEASRCRCAECGMVFQRQDHLRRHSVLHEGRKPFVCSRCSRRFSRRDTLDRHESTHDSSSPGHRSSKPTRKPRGEKACTSCRLSKQRCDGADPCSRCVRKHISCQYLPRRARQISRWRMHTDQAGSATAKELGGLEKSMRMTSGLEKSPPLWEEEQHAPQIGPSTNLGEETMSVSSRGSSTLGAGLQQPVVLEDMTLGPSDMIKAWEEVHNADWANDQANYYLSTGSSLDPPTQIPPPAEAAFGSITASTARCDDSLSTDWLPSFPWPPQPLTQSGCNSSSPAHPPGSWTAELEDFCHVEELSSEGYENLRLWACMTAPSLEPSVLPALRTLNAFIQLYFEKFHDTLPIIHRPTFDPSSAPRLLVLAIANIGRRFSRVAGGLSNELGLETLVHDTVKRHIESFQTSETVPLWLAQAALLCHIAMSFTNNRAAVERSQVTRGVLDVILKRLEPSLVAAASSLREGQEEGSDGQAKWKVWAHCESLRRTAYGLWLLDSQCCLLFDLTPVVPTEALGIPLPCHERLWEKSTAVSWKPQWAQTKELPALREAMQSLYSLNPVSEDVGAFSFLIILFGHFRDRLFLKQAEDMGLLGLVNMHGERITYGMERQPELWQLLDPTRRPGSNNRSHAVTVQYYHIIGVLLYVPLKELLAFSGWRVTPAKQQEARQKLKAWVSAHGNSARAAALHAGTLFRQCWCRSTSGYQEPGAILIATLALWVYNSSLPRCTLTGGEEAPGEKKHSTPTFRLDNETDQDEVLDWVRDGKRARPFVIGVGDINAPGGYSRAVNQATAFLASQKEWQISQLFSGVLKSLAAIL